MMREIKDGAAAVAAALSDRVESPLESNLFAVATAEALAKGKSRAELEELCKFLQMLQSALKAYM